ncbi:MAG: signal peptidase II [Chloroflexi bacterium]|nr:signal peptidase II [Chloroflexota bacterium]
MERLPDNAPASIWQRALPLWIAGGIIALDQLTKFLVEATLPLYHGWTPFPNAPYLHISHLGNAGSAFGLFPANSDIFAWAAVIVSLAILYYNYTLPAGQSLFRLALGLQLGGANGNLIDRLRLGHVTDFIDFGPWVFNVADAAIVSGAFILAFVVWRESKQMVPLPLDRQELSDEACT